MLWEAYRGDVKRTVLTGPYYRLVSLCSWKYIEKRKHISVAGNSAGATSQLSYSLQLLLLMAVCKGTFWKRGSPSRKAKKKKKVYWIYFLFFPINSFIQGWLWNVRNKQRSVDLSAWWPSEGTCFRNLSTKLRDSIPKLLSEFWGFE